MRAQAFFLGVFFLVSSLSFAETPLPLSDGEVVAIIQAVDRAEVSESKIAQAKTSDADIKSLADMIVSDHSEELTKLEALEKDLPAVEDDISRAWTKESIGTIAKLESLDGEPFNCAYIASQVDIHQRLVDSMKLLPQVENATLDKLIQKDEPLAKHHLAEAKKLQESLCPGN